MIRRTITNHARKMLKARFGIENMPAALEWINKHVPQGEGRLIHGDYTFVFSPVEQETQALITIFRTRPNRVTRIAS